MSIDTIIEKLENGACVGGKCTPKGKAEKGFCICHEAAEALRTQTLCIQELEAKIAEFTHEESHGETYPPEPGR